MSKIVKARYRDHRGSLDESLKTTREFTHKRELIEYLQNDLKRYAYFPKEEEFRIEPYSGDDDRIGWKDVHIVRINGFGVLGMVEGVILKNIHEDLT